MLKRSLALLSMILITLCTYGQTDVGVQLQVYPTGIIVGATAEFAISDRAFVTTRLGANIFDHRDLGKQKEEKGSGFGGTIGYKRYFGTEALGWWGSVQTDIWKNNVEWLDNASETQETKITVLQPTLSLGHAWMLGDSWILSPALSFGLEWNIVTDGEPTGEGPILLGGVTIAKRF